MVHLKRQKQADVGRISPFHIVGGNKLASEALD